MQYPKKLKSLGKLIKELNRLDLDKIESSELEEKLKDLISKLPMFVTMSKSTERYFRARISNDENLNYVSQIEAPPKELVKGYQRCNPPKKPMFYSSSRRLTALLECSADVGDIVYLSQWMSKEKMPLNSILDDKNNDIFYEKITAEQSAVLAYLDTIFTRKIHSSFSNQYKITAAITKIITDNYPLDTKQNISENRKIGLVYPSIYDAAGSYNTVLHPEFIEERMELQHVMKLEIKRKIEQDFKVKVIDNAINFENGKIHWLNNKNSIPKLLESKSKVPFIYDGKNWNITINETAINNKSVNQILCE